MIIFNFILIFLKKIHIESRFKFLKIKCIFLHKMSNLRKWVTCRWNIDLKKIQVSVALKNTYVLSNYACYDHNI
jgi:hypothetical protein